MKVCAYCFNDFELRKFISSNYAERGKCKFCGKDQTELIDINELLDFFSEFIGIFEKDESGIPIIELIEDHWNLFSYEKSAQKILEYLLPASNKIITDPLDKVNYDEEILECVSHWDDLKEDLKWKRRFLTDVNYIIYELGWDSFFDKQMKLAYDEVLYRARINEKAGQSAFDKEDMGCPPIELTTEGRANPQGIPFLYLCKSIETTMYEVRATYLDEISVGKFRMLPGKEIVLVDFTEDISLFFNTGNIKEYAKSVLLKNLISTDLSRPLRRYDSAMDYIPTQFICEFIRFITGADGILFSSSLHKDGKNIVLFEQHKVQCFEVSKHRITNVVIESEEV